MRDWPSLQAGPFVVTDSFVRVLQVQSFLATLAIIPILLTMFVTEMRIGMNRIAESESRYRNFVEHSSEAVWRVELDQPMAVSMPMADQHVWLEQHAHVAECSLSYSKLSAPESTSALQPWRREIPWNSIYDQHLDQAARQNYSMDGLRFDLPVRGKHRTFITSFTGVVKEGCLLRIWGVARDVTDLMELNTRLAREQDRLRGYARQIVTAEERARRATAIDLHDGIGQELIGMAMTLEALRSQAPRAVAEPAGRIAFATARGAGAHPAHDLRPEPAGALRTGPVPGAAVARNLPAHAPETAGGARLQRA